MERVKEWMAKPYVGVLFVLVALVALFQSLNPVFLTPLNIATMLRSASYIGIISVGMGLCMVSGMIDLSVGSTSALASVMFGWAMVHWGLPLVPAILITIAAGAVIGLVNAFIILRMGVSPFVTTISTMFMIKGVALAWNKGFLIYPLPDGVAEIGNLKPLGVSVAFVIFLVVTLVAWYVLERTVFGLEIRATGSDYEVAKVTEVRYILVHVSLLAGIGALAALAGILTSFILNAGAPNVGIGWEFAAITACVIGGISMFGYEGSIPGVVLGVLTVQVLRNGIVMSGVSVYLQDVVTGVVLLAAIVLDVRRRKYLNMERI